MQPGQNIKQKPMAPNKLVLLAIIAISTTVATGALAAGRVGGAGHSGGFGAAHLGELRGPLVDRAPLTQPHFNPSSPYTVPQPRETPVSPGSPGSVFGND
jgi:hypothetical protein